MQTKQGKEEKSKAFEQRYGLIVMIVLLVICAILYFINNSSDAIEPIPTYLPSPSPTQNSKASLTHNIFIARLDRVDESDIFRETDHGIYKAETDYTSASIVLIADDHGSLSAADLSINLTYIPVGDDPSSITDRLNSTINEKSLLMGYDLLTICVEALCGISSHTFEDLLPFLSFIDLTDGNKSEITFPNGTVLKLSGETHHITASFSDLCGE